VAHLWLAVSVCNRCFSDSLYLHSPWVLLELSSRPPGEGRLTAGINKLEAAQSRAFWDLCSQSQRVCMLLNSTEDIFESPGSDSSLSPNACSLLARLRLDKSETRVRFITNLYNLSKLRWRYLLNVLEYPWPCGVGAILSVIYHH